MALHAHVLDIQDHLAGGDLRLVHVEVHVAAHHHGGELLHGHVLGLHGADVLALSQHAAPVGHGHDLGQLVADEQDALALGGQVLHDLHQLVDLLGRQHGGGLVEDQDLVVAVEHLEDLGALLHADGDVRDLRVRVHLQAIALGELDHALAGLRLLQKAHLAGRLHAQDDVVQHREAFHQLEVLVHHADAQVVGVVRVVDPDFLAVLLDRALFRLVQAEQHAHQRGLARAVFAEQGVDLALFQLERDVVVGDDAGETLRDVQHFNGILVFQGCFPPMLWFHMDEPLTKTSEQPLSRLRRQLPLHRRAMTDLPASLV